MDVLGILNASRAKALIISAISATQKSTLKNLPSLFEKFPIILFLYL
jgi:hypothetical protein